MTTDDTCELLCLDLPHAERIRLLVPAVAELEPAAVTARALGDPTRLRIAAALLAGDELCVCDTAWIVGASQALVSHHLRQLRTAGVVELAQGRPDGHVHALRPGSRRCSRSCSTASWSAPARPAVSDGCCGPSPPPDEGPTRIRQVRELQLAAVAALLLGAAWLVDVLAGGPEPLVIGLELAAAVVAASTFVPGALRALRHGRIDVGTLMTIAAVGAVALGRVAEAALLGILFSIAEGLEHHAVARTRRGLRALLSLVPPTATVLRDGREIAVGPDELVVG